MATKTTYVEIAGDTSKYERAMRNVQLTNKKTTQAISSAWKSVAGIVGGLWVGAGLKSMMSEWVSLAGQQQQAVAGMTQAMVSMERFTPELKAGLLNVASSIQDMTTFGDEAIISGQKFLLTYRNITDDLLPRTSMAMADLAALMGGGPGGVTRAANMLGKASMGMTGELRRVGITVDQATFKSEGFLGVLEQIEQQVSGQARALAETGIGPWQQLTNIWGDAKESLGELVLILGKEMNPILKTMALQVRDIAQFWGAVLSGPTTHMEVMIKKLTDLRKRREELESVWGRGIIGKLLGVTTGDPVAELARVNREIDLTVKSINELNRIRTLPPAAGGPAGGVAGTGSGAGGTDPGMARLEEQAQMMMLKSQETLTQKTEMEKFMEQGLTEALYEMRQQRLETETGFSQQTLELRQWEHDAAIQLMQMQAEEEIRIEEAKNKAKTQAALNYMQAGMNIANAIQAFTGKQNKIVFAAAKALETAKAVITAFSAANMTMASLPYPANIIAAASVLAMGLANAAAIAATAMGQMSGGGGGMGSVSTGAVPAAPVPVASPEPILTRETRPSLTIHIEGDMIGDESYVEKLAEKISEAVENRDVRLFASGARLAEGLT